MCPRSAGMDRCSQGTARTAGDQREPGGRGRILPYALQTEPGPADTPGWTCGSGTARQNVSAVSAAPAEAPRHGGPSGLPQGCFRGSAVRSDESRPEVRGLAVRRGDLGWERGDTEAVAGGRWEGRAKRHLLETKGFGGRRLLRDREDPATQPPTLRFYERGEAAFVPVNFQGESELGPLRGPHLSDCAAMNNGHEHTRLGSSRHRGAS